MKHTAKGNNRMAIQTSTLDPRAYLVQGYGNFSSHSTSRKTVVRTRSPGCHASVGNAPKHSKMEFIQLKHVQPAGKKNENRITFLERHRLRLSYAGQSLTTKVPQHNREAYNNFVFHATSRLVSLIMLVMKEARWQANISFSTMCDTFSHIGGRLESIFHKNPSSFPGMRRVKYRDPCPIKALTKETPDLKELRETWIVRTILALTYTRGLLQDTRVSSWF